MVMELHDYDIYPKVFPVGKAVEITIKPLGRHVAFSGEYELRVHRMDHGTPWTEEKCWIPKDWNTTTYTVETAEDGCLRITYTAEAESEHYVYVYKDGKKLFRLAVYALAEDLACRIPYRGDLHVHTYRSDGHSDPATTCAYYRKLGYDFIVITDHRRYYPSLEAINAYKGVKTALNILPGEEVHIPQTMLHIVNAGGLFSVNGLFTDKTYYYDFPYDGGNERDTNGELNGRRFDETIDPPAIRTPEMYNAELDVIEKQLLEDGYPADAEPRSFAVAMWAFDKIREAGGLAIFPHPYWITSVWHENEVYTREMMKRHPFDAFEVLGGENYYQHNGIQTALYYDEYRHGRVHAIVGSTDSHCPYDNNRNYNICSTIVFAHENERVDLLNSIKEGYSVAVDSISAEYRLVGEHRLQKYAAFLMEYFYPIHDRQSQFDGEMMRRYYVGEATAEEVELLAKKNDELFAKYFVR